MICVHFLMTKNLPPGFYIVHLSTNGLTVHSPIRYSSYWTALLALEKEFPETAHDLFAAALESLEDTDGSVCRKENRATRQGRRHFKI